MRACLWTKRQTLAWKRNRSAALAKYSPACISSANGVFPSKVLHCCQYSCASAGARSSDVVQTDNTRRRVHTSRPPLRLSRESKIQLGILYTTRLLIDGGIAMIVPVLPGYAQSLNMGAAGVGLIVAAPSIAKVVLNLPMGKLTDILGRKPPMVLGVLVDGLGCIGTAMAGGLTSMMSARLLTGAGSAAAGCATQAYTMDVVSKYPEHKGLLLGTSTAVGMLAFTFGPMLGGLMGEQFGMNTPFLMLGALLCACAPIYYLLPETAVPQTNRAFSVQQALTEATSSFGELARDPNQQALLAMRFATVTGYSCALTVLPLHAADSWGASAGDLGKLYSLVTIGGLVGAPAFGALADRYGRKPIALIGSVTWAVATAGLSAAATEPDFYAVLVPWVLGNAAVQSATTALAADVTREELRGSQNSLMNQMSDFSWVVMPMTLGAVAAHVSYDASFILAAALMVSASATFARQAKT